MSIPPSADITVPIVKIKGCEDIPLPVYQSAGAAGADIHAALSEDMTLAPMARAMVPTGLKIALPSGYEAQIRPRSGLAIKQGVTVINAPGTIDSDFRGEIQIGLINLSAEPVMISRGMRIAQMVIAPVTLASFRLSETLDDTERGTGGFGSTGQ